MIKVLLIDYYGVFQTDPYSAWLQANNLAREGIYKSLIVERDSGSISEEDFLGCLSKSLNRHITIDEIHIADSQLDTELVQLVRSLQSNYKIYLFSNASPSLRDKLSIAGIYDLFEEVILSSEIGHVKPSDEAFEIAINKTGVTPAEMLFVDDNPDNIEAARKHNLRTCRYTSLEKLRETLQNID